MGKRKKNNQNDNNTKIENFITKINNSNECTNTDSNDKNINNNNNNNSNINNNNNNNNNKNDNEIKGKESIGNWWKERCNEQVLSFKKEYSETEMGSKIFEGIKVYFDGLSGEVSTLHLKKLIFLNGGTTSHWFSPTEVTHIVGTHMSLNKFETVKRMGVNTSRIRNGKIIHYVSSDWILDSCKLLKLQNESKYKLFNESASLHGSKDIRSFFNDKEEQEQEQEQKEEEEQEDNEEENEVENKEIKNKKNNDYNDIIETDEYSLFSKIKKSKVMDDEELEKILINPNHSCTDYLSSFGNSTLETFTTSTISNFEKDRKKYIDKNENASIKDFVIERAQSKKL
ncbi:hypothetical protein ACTFIW_001872 [Dictyostelium discoideum]